MMDNYRFDGLRFLFWAPPESLPYEESEMNIAIWIVQGLLGLAFLMAGLMKAARSGEELKDRIA